MITRLTHGSDTSVQASNSTPQRHHPREPSIRASTSTPHQFLARDSATRVGLSPSRLGHRRRETSVDSGSPPTSRAASPLRFLQSLTSIHRVHSRSDEPFIPVDPFQLRLSLRIRPLHHANSAPDGPDPSAPASTAAVDVNDDEGYAFECNDTVACACCCLPLPGTMTCGRSERAKPQPFATAAHVAETLVRFAYLHAHLRLPALYFSRVARIFEDAEVSRREVQRMIDTAAGASRFGTWDGADSALRGMLRREREREERAAEPAVGGRGRRGRGRAQVQAEAEAIPLGEMREMVQVSPALAKFKHSWEAFIDSLMKEWKTLNIVSALLLS
jgi:hypothetical protein